LSIAFGLRLRPVFDVAIPGLYAWVVTVAVPVYQKDASGWPVAFSWFSATCLCVTSGLVVSRLRPWSAIAASLFVLSSSAVWFLIAPFEASLGFLGSLGWASFAIGWVRAAGTGEDMSGGAARRIELPARQRMPALSWVMLGIGLAGALSALILAWNIEGRERSLLGQAVAVIGALALITAASSFASAVGPKAAARTFSNGQLARTLVLLGLFALGCWLTFSRT
jgi:hypothetical protein